MILKQLRLFNFRVYTEQLFYPSPGLNLITGPNGAGKTAILEALYLLSAARSYRTRRESEVCRWGESSCRIEGSFLNDRSHRRDLALSWQRIDGQWRKEASFQNDPVSRLADFLGCIPLSLFTPDDLTLISGSPSVRRKYLDLMLSKMYPLHLLDLSRLRKVLTSRNALLRQGRPANELRPWDKLLYDLAIKVGQRREEVVVQLAESCNDYFQQLSGGTQTLRIEYKRCWPEEWEAFRDRLREMYQRERQRGATLLSPQKDELDVHTGGRSLRTYGSQGDKRLVALCLRLAEAKQLAVQKSEQAILLLDDVFSEFDTERKERLLHLLPEFSQVFITSATPLELGSLPHSQHSVDQGQIAESLGSNR